MAILDTVKKFGLRVKTATGYITYKLGSEFVQMDNGKDLQTAFDDLNDDLNKSLNVKVETINDNSKRYWLKQNDPYDPHIIIVVIGTVVKQSSGDYLEMFTIDELYTILGFSKGEQSIDIAKLSIYSYNADADAAPVHFYNIEYWGLYNRFYQYFYPSHSGSVRANYRIEYLYR